jgi:transcriptional regulator with PAS, ATPase and Fis domain
MLLRSVLQTLGATRDFRTARMRFEDDLRSLVHAQQVAVCEAAGPPPDPQHTVVDVPAVGVAGGARIELQFGTGRTLDGWTCDLLDAAAMVAALVLEIERGQGRAPRFARPAPTDTPALVGSSQAMQLVRERIDRVAATDFTVLIEGESGTGKELVARQIHERSRRRRGPFVAVNCAAIVETLLEAELFGIEERTATGVRGRRGKFEHAHGGTLFLDEVSDLSTAAQAKLLRALQDLAVERVGGAVARQVDTRIIVATNRPLRELVDQRLFRLDLYYRLSGVDVQVPPLRVRREDIPELVYHFLERHRELRPLDLTVAATDALQAYDWPGNVRELQRVIERAIALAATDRIDLPDLPAAIVGRRAEVLEPSLRARESMRAFGSRYARLVLDRCDNNKRRACRELGISYHTLNAYLRFSPDRSKRAPAGPGGLG